MKNTLVAGLEKRNQFVTPAMNAKDAFLPQKTTVNSWFFIGRCKSNEHDIAFLFHVMSMKLGVVGFINGAFSITDKSTGFYKSKEFMKNSLNPASDKNGVLTVNMGKASLKGNLESDISLRAEIDNCSFEAVVHPKGNIIYNGGTGFFPMLQSKKNWQYSCPEMKMDASITIDGKTVQFKNADCWLDRQYNILSMGKRTRGDGVMLKWMWMGIKLDNGYSISLWELLPEEGPHYCFATILKPNGNQTVCQIDSMVEHASEIWESDITKQKYPTKWKVNILEFNAELVVVSSPKQQEIVSKMKPLNRYEGESKVTGTFENDTVTGECCVELIGEWR